MCIGVATSRSPVGPFTDTGAPMRCGPGFSVIDPMAFDDPQSGKKYLYWGSNSEPIYAQELAADRVHFAPQSEPVPVVRASEQRPNERLIEGPWVIFRQGYYYMFYSGDNCCGKKAHYGVLVARAKSPTGPFELRPGPSGVILDRSAAWDAPGHNAVIADAAGQDWMLYHAIDPRRPTQPCPIAVPGQVLACKPGDDEPSRRPMLLDRIVYRDGWPEIEQHAPSSTRQTAPVIDRGRAR
jgi:arabinan endo-1,5-alpha-L-arabinosidase